MRLPQDRILHIDIDFENGKVNVVAEWQGELVRCKDCKNNYNTCTNHGINQPMCDFTDRMLKETDFCSRGELADKTKYPATYNTNTKCGGCVHLDELGRCLNFMLAKDDRSCWRGSWENNNGELAEQTERREK